MEEEKDVCVPHWVLYLGDALQGTVHKGVAHNPQDMKAVPLDTSARYHLMLDGTCTYR
jgi:hypothetical protein